MDDRSSYRCVHMQTLYFNQKIKIISGVLSNMYYELGNGSFKEWATLLGGGSIS